jgi:glycosyltransferase involved in cell wall biosynthesis
VNDPAGVTAPPLVSFQPPDGRRPLVFAWGVSSYFGWGLYGLNLAMSLANHPVFCPIAAMEFGPGDVVLDPLRKNLIQGVGTLSSELWATLGTLPQSDVRIDAPLLMGLGKDLHSVASAAGTFLTGQPTIGVTFIEHSTLSEAGRQRADQLALIIAGSSWNESVLRANGIVATTTVLQGVDTSLFHPAPSTGRFRDRFVIFSGGKLEYRKGQDLVVKAFRIFQQRHDEALLLTAWNTPWQWHDPFMAAGTDTVPVTQGADGWVDTAAWAIANGVPPHALIALGKVPNIAMPHVVREANVALFPNRCEGGTNLVAMECMACGIPTILSGNTGHLDLLERDVVAYRLDRQGTASCEGYETQDWGESDVEEILEKLEAVWRDRQQAAAIGQSGAAFIAPLTWDRQASLLLRAIEPLLP